MNRTRASLLLLAASLASLSATGCHRHRVARGAHPSMVYQPRMVMMAPQPIVIVVETRAAGAPDADYAQEAAAREEVAREEAERQARIAQERARREHERAERVRIAHERAERAERAELARAEREQAARDAQARAAAAAQGQTTIIVVGPGGAQPVRVNGWFEGQ